MTGKPSNATTRALRVLVVDDDRDSAESMRLLAGVWGHEARVAHDGQSALELARELAPDVVLMDLSLGQESGHEVASKLRRECGSATLVAVSGWDRLDARGAKDPAVFDHHLVKPVEPTNLRNVLASIHASRSLS